MRSDNIAIDALRRLIRYEANTGRLFWLPRTKDLFFDAGHSAAHSCAKWNAKLAGKEAFTALNNGRPHGRIHRRIYFASRVAWALTYGYWPVEIDHINRNRADNRLVNLRECTHAQNLCNQSSTRGSSSRFVGVAWDSSRRKWVARISPNGTSVSLGRFAKEEDAAKAYDAAALKYFGEFANINLPEQRSMA